MLANQRTVGVRFGECDPHGIVFYPRFLEFFDASGDALREPTGRLRQKMLRTYQMPLADFRTSFLRPSRYGDRIVIESRVLECGWNSCSVRHKRYHGKVLAVEGVEKTRTGHANQAHFVATQRPSDSERDQRTGFALRGWQ